jgi:hypothetical protein
VLAIDHIVVAVADLDGAGARFSTAYGLASVPGGRHPQMGTSNRIVPLGSSYLELLAPFEGPDRLAGWLVRCDDAAREARRLGVDVVDMVRERPDGSVLRWRLAGVGSVFDPLRPTFIEWVDGPDGLAAVGALEWLEVPGPLDDWLGGREVSGGVRVGDRFAACIRPAGGAARRPDRPGRPPIVLVTPAST